MRRRASRTAVGSLAALLGLPVLLAAGPAHADTTALPGTFTSVTPARALDTRIGLGAPAGPVAGNAVVRLKVDGVAGLPDSGVGTVVMNVTVTQPQGSGFLAVYPDAAAAPTVSNVNFKPGQDRANLVTVPVSVDGYVDLRNGSARPVQIVADIDGWYAAGTPTVAGAFAAVDPARILDTRTGLGVAAGPLAAGTSVDVPVTGRAGIPAQGVSAVVLNVTAVQPDQAGYLTVYPAGTVAPYASNVNFTAGDDAPNSVVVKVGAAGAVSVLNGSGGGTQLVVDVNGYFRDGTPTDPGTFVPVAPTRVVDTRDGTGTSCSCAVTPGGTMVATVPAVPDKAVLVANVTVAQPTGAGYLTAYSGQSAAPLASNINYAPGLDVPNLVTVSSSGGRVDFFNGSRGSTHVVADLAGYYLTAGRGSAQNPPQAPTTPAPTSTPTTPAPTSTPTTPAPTTTDPTSAPAPTVTAAPAAATTYHPALANQTWPDKRVWAHYIGQGLANYSDMGTGTDNYYGDLYPLDLVHGTYSATPRSTAGVPRALQAGITGMQVLLFDFNHGGDFTTQWMQQADSTWTDSNPNNNFMVSPVLEVSTVANAVRIIQEFAQAASGHPSAGRVNGKLVIWVYDPRNLSPTDWQTVRTQLGALNSQLYFIGDLQTAASQTNYQLDSTKTVPWFPAFDASWEFDDSIESIWDSVTTQMNQYGRQYAGGFMPGYDRETCATDSSCGHIDAQGTKRYRRLWDLALATGSGWQTVDTWSDMVERTEVQATSNWNSTRSDITAFYSAKLRGIAFPKPRAELYVTTPQQVHIGEAVQAEGLVLNGSSQTVNVRITLVDPAGNPVGTTVSADVAPGAAADATTLATELVNSMPASHFYRAKAVMYNKATGAVLESVTSAPIVVYAAGVVPTPNLHRLYYSIPAAQALPGTPTLALSGSPVTSTTATATVTPPAGTSVRFSEVLQNTRQVGNGFSSSTYTVKVPMSSRTIIGNQVTTASAHGFYVGRVIDSQERVGYSDPIYVP